MDAVLKRKGQRLEDLFFAEQDAKLIAKQKELARTARTQQALADVSGITNQEVLRKLVELGISPALLASLAVVPLVEVAWADGSVHEKERKAIMDGAAGAGIGRGSVDYELLEEWLAQPPPAPLLEAWEHYISGLCQALSEQDRKALELSLLSRARLVAEAAGGFFALVSKVSAQEEAILDRMARAFTSSPARK
jgi:DnaJ-domain-containing protein 1